MNIFENEPKPFPTVAHEPEPLGTLPLYTSSAPDSRRLFHEQRLVLERRAEHARTQVSLRRHRDGNQSELDPVLRFHRGLD